MASAEAAVAKLSTEQALPAHATTALPPHLCPGSRAKAASMLFSGLESEGGRKHPGPLSTHAQIFKPGPEEKNWSCTGLAKEYQPQSKKGKYYCPMCPLYEGRLNIDTVSTHIKHGHLNISLGCHFCEEAFFSSEGWKRHTSLLSSLMLSLVLFFPFLTMFNPTTCVVSCSLLQLTFSNK